MSRLDWPSRRLRVHMRLTYQGLAVCDNPRAVRYSQDAADVTCENCHAELAAREYPPNRSLKP